MLFVTSCQLGSPDVQNICAQSPGPEVLTEGKHVGLLIGCCSCTAAAASDTWMYSDFQVGFYAFSAECLAALLQELLHLHCAPTHVSHTRDFRIADAPCAAHAFGQCVSYEFIAEFLVSVLP